jgi:hypothetical protein
MIYRVPCEQALELLDKWLNWARRSRLTPFVKLAKTITNQRRGIEAALRHGLSNARTEQVNQHPDPTDHPPRVRLPLTLGRHRTRNALTRRPLPTPPRPGDTTHGSCRRSLFFRCPLWTDSLSRSGGAPRTAVPSAQEDLRWAPRTPLRNENFFTLFSKGGSNVL